jgi:very-short-patch-repair endonuclease/DNA polymerase III delta prime subunit
VSEIETKKKLLSSRKDLLDIGLRNSMISFKAGVKSLMIVDELSEEVLKTIYWQTKSMTFAPMPEKRLRQLVAQRSEPDSVEDTQDESTLELLHELEGVNWATTAAPDGGSGTAKRHTDTKLQTALADERLFLHLIKIHTEAETYIQEQGVNVLFLALGFLHWYEADASDKLRKAPLLLVPVELKRGSRDTFHLEYTGDDLIQNLSLAARIKTDFALDLPQYAMEAAVDGEEIPPLADFYAEVSDCVSKQKRWKVASDEIHLGFFSFGKFLMFNDLDSAVWPADKQPSAHPVLSRLLGDGFGGETASVAEGVHLDSVIEPGEVRFVRDADSTQTLAILEARAGRNLVIQGPPGTGKSQTITNIIAELLGGGKSVLFVAEKMAALEVVKRRLDESHLGDAVLELHSHKVTRQSVLKELARTLDQGKPLAKDGADDIDALKEVRNELNAYCSAVNNPVGASQVPFIKALGCYLKLKREYGDLPIWSFVPMNQWTQAKQTRLREKVSELEMQLQVMGQPSKNPFWGSLRSTFSPVEQVQLTAGLTASIALLRDLSSSADKVASHLGLGRPVTVTEVGVICRAAQRAAEAPRLQGLQLSTNDWQSRRDVVRELLEAGRRMTSVQTKHEAMLIDQAWEQPMLTERQHFANFGDKWWRVFSSKFRQSRARMQGLCKSPLSKDNLQCLALIDGILEFQKNKTTYDQHAALGEALFGAQWNKQRSDWEVLGRLSEWVFTLYDDLGKGSLPAGIVDFLSGHADASGLGEAILPIREAVLTLQVQIEDLVKQLRLEKALPPSSLLVLPLHALQEQLEGWLQDVPKLYQLVRFNQLQQEMIPLGLGDVIEKATDWARPSAHLTHAFDLTWYSGLVEKGYADAPSLLTFDHVKQTHLLERFRRLDQSSLGHAQAELAKAIWEKKPGINQPGEMAVLRNELNKKRRLMPIRQLIDRAGRAIQHIKPVFMMSPMSIANFLPPGKLEFDVVIFDEASQVKAVDAFGAVLRGRQVIVVGDTRQMPPSDFFGRDVEIDDEDNVTSDIESVLAMFRARGAQERYLSWHYRSRHESLIAVSNVEFYDRKLVIFPTPGTNKLATGLRLRHLPQALYDRGRTRTNRGEAKALAQAVMEHATHRPGMSLGVVAFSMAQRDLIQVEVELMRRADQNGEAFFNGAHPTEPFFIKNLENVQGDERDVIFISIGYGRNESGRIAKEFGPVNRDGGERRLNVLISRAKMAMEVFCNFRAEDLELDANASHGVRALKHFLSYAETRQLDIPIETGKESDSPFELEVMNALIERGYLIEAQVGTAGYFIDLAVKDPESPGRYVLAIECDGASYHSSRSARDRDRLRQGVLESLGWRFHRIWSTDWFRNPGQELERTAAAIDTARQAIMLDKPADITIKPVSAPVILRDTVDDIDLASVAMAYRKASLPNSTSAGYALHELPTDRLAILVKSVVAVESPVHEAEVTKRLMESFGVSRAGSRIVESGLFHHSGGFVYADKTCSAAVRNRSALDTAERKIEWVSPEELDTALIDMVRLSFSISKEAAVSGALESLGFGRVTTNIAHAMDNRVSSLIKVNRLNLQDEKLVLTSSPP